jgi:hypothetical protein
MNYDATGKTFTVPNLNYLVAAYGYNTGTSPGLLRYQFQTPSLKSDSVPLEIDQVDTTATNPGSLPCENCGFQYFGDTPVMLKPGELLEADVLTGGGTAGQVVVLAWLDDNVQSVVSGKIIPGVRATSATTLTANTWTPCPVTFDNTLPVGSYAIIGMHVESATGYAARCAIPGFPWRMGVIPTKDTTSYFRPLYFRNGRWGSPSSGQYVSWGAFINTTPPQIEMLALAGDTSETFLFDLVKIA